MSLNSSLTAAVAGLSAQSTRMAAIADNIANSQTVGYKKADVQFRTLVTAAGGSGGYSAGGAAPIARARIADQGQIQGTQATTDLAIDGAGFFVVRDGADGAALFTRAGSFRPDEAGRLRNAAGHYLQGWKLDASGVYVNSGSTSAMETVSMASVTNTADPTTRIDFRANLDAGATPVAGYTAGAMARGEVQPQLSRVMELFDAQGMAHQVTLGFAKLGPNRWAVEAYAVPAAQVSSADGIILSGELQFGADGKLDMAGSSPGLFAPASPAWTNGAGSAPLTLRFGDQGTGLTQFGGDTTTLSLNVNGGQSGSATAFTVSPDGRVSALFEDGTTREVYQLAIATFANPDGLTRVGGNGFRMSMDSGPALMQAGGEGAAGKVLGSSLEASTVDIAAEMADMIRTQRAYSANSKVVMTADEMLSEVSSLKR